MSGAAKIRAINDAARRTLIGCRVMLTSGVQALGRMPEVLAAVRGFDDFNARAARVDNVSAPGAEAGCP